MKNIYYLYLSILCFFLFFFLSIFIINGNSLFFDMPIFQFLRNFPFSSFFLTCTFFGGTFFLVSFVLLSYFFFKNKSHWKFFVSMMVLELSSNFFLKFFFGRPRPNVSRLITESGFSFPSGHMMASTMCYGLCIYFLWQSSIQKGWKVLGSFGLSIFVLLIGLSRIYLGVHYASDVLGGFLVSLSLLSFGIFFYQSTHQNVKKTVNTFENDVN